MKRLLLLSLLLPVTACGGAREADSVRPSTPALSSQGFPVRSVAQAELASANWKERMSQGYVFVEHAGDYRTLGDAMRRLMKICSAEGIEADGAPFALFYDDPGAVPIERLRSRACLPVADGLDDLPDGVSFEVLPRSMVVYTRVSGAYPEVPRAYPTLFRYLDDLGWSQGGPIREVYLVDPRRVETYDELVTEIQIPWVAGG